MIPSHKHLNLSIAITLIGLIGLAFGHVEEASITIFAGLLKFETYKIVKHYEELDK